MLNIVRTDSAVSSSVLSTLIDRTIVWSVPRPELTLLGGSI